MQIHPFAAVRPFAGKAAEVAALPYDVFDEDEARAYVQDRPHSFLNIDRPETQFAPGADPYAPRVYGRAQAMFEAWRRNGIFTQDEGPCFYLYQLSDPEPSADDTREKTGGLPHGWSQTGIVACCALDDFADGVIKRHEKTREEKELDRIRHIDALDAQTGPIFCTFRDEEAVAACMARSMEADPLYDFVDADGARERVWRVSEPSELSAFAAAFSHVPCAYIADGHHRAASAVKVGLARRDAAVQSGSYTGCEPFNFVMTVLFPASELTVLAYNRVVADRAGLTAGELLDRVAEAGFAVEKSDSAVEPGCRRSFGLFTAGSWYLLTAGEKLCAAADAADAADALDASLLQRALLDPVLGIENPRLDARISFVGGIRGTRELERRAGEDGVAITLHATSVEELMAVADARLLMPPKSTWFEPKLRSGLFAHLI